MELLLQWFSERSPIPLCNAPSSRLSSPVSSARAVLLSGVEGWSLMGDAISHAVLPGIVLAFVFSIPLAIGAFLSGIFCAGRDGLSERTQPGKGRYGDGDRLLRHVCFGLVLFARIDTDQHLSHILFGNMLGITDGELQQHCGSPGSRWRSYCSSARTLCFTVSIRTMRASLVCR
ncbi:Manganese transport system membrane protein mntB [Serratia fonticola]|uniref:Manganese transport system membrane protein mntB n=1 Tax=Serratia fonticola TaxID=47917 RepID=A0A4U9WIH4_SERFO|nr:Manganese transport system membrane protein mntB [Serratia fonticola]